MIFDIGHMKAAYNTDVGIGLGSADKKIKYLT